MQRTQVSEPVSADRIDLTDGRLVVRPVRPADAVSIDALVRGLSDRSAYHRFHGPRYRLSAAELARFVDVDHRRNETLLVVDPASGELVAVGQYVGLDRPHDGGGPVAEIALLVIDAWQGRGVGRLLAQRLLEAAADAGFVAVTASMLAGNRPALALADRLRPEAVHPRGTTVDIRIDLPVGTSTAGVRTVPTTCTAAPSRRASTRTRRNRHAR